MNAVVTRPLRHGPNEAAVVPAWALAAAIAAAAGAAALVGLAVAAREPRLAPLLPVAGAGLAFVVLRPRWLLPAFVAFTWLSIRESFYHGLPSPVEGGALVLLAVAIVRARREPELTGCVLLVAALIALPLAGTSLLAEEVARVPLGRLTELAFLPIAALAVTHVRDVERTATLLSLAGLFLGLGAVWSVLVGPTELFPHNPSGAAVGAEPARAAGPFGEANFFGLSMATLIPLALHQLQAPGWRWALGATSTLALVVGVYATGSRGALIAAVLALVASGLASRERALRLAALGLVLAAIAVLPLFAAQAGASADRTVDGRLSENLIAVAMFADHPLTGVGAGGYAPLYRDYGREIGDDPRSNRSPHSLPLEIAAEQGVAGIAGWLAALAVLVAALRRGGVWQAPLGRPLALAAITYAIGSAFLHGSQLRLPFLLGGLLLGYSYALSACRGEPPEAARRASA